MPISLFWFAWCVFISLFDVVWFMNPFFRTSTGNVLWISPLLAGVPFGYAMLSIVGFIKFNDRKSLTPLL